ncbi:MAG: hypothetical protein Q9170_005393 [Blastenia crenularia]
MSSKTSENEGAASQDSEHGSTDIGLAAEKAALRKVDWHVLPMFFLYYMVSFLDRSNIGNGRLYGLEEDLGLKGDQFQTATSVFFATYVIYVIYPRLLILEDLPSTLLGIFGYFSLDEPPDSACSTQPPDTPRYTMGHAVSIATLAISAAVSGILWQSMVRINRRREAGGEDWKVAGMTGEEVDQLGDESPRFRFGT